MPLPGGSKEALIIDHLSDPYHELINLSRAPIFT
jgi:hypothetical protein